MENQTQNNKRIAKNTLFLYLRMMLLMLISLYTSRVILKTLGVDDYGTYNVVGGIVTMFSVLGGSLSYSISRFLTFELGRGDINRMKLVFSTGMNIQLIMGLIVVLLTETLGLWFLLNKMVIPPGRMTAAIWVLQLSVLTFIFNLINVPYNAAIVAHEKMDFFAFVSIYEGLTKLAIAASLILITFDKLITFAVLTAILYISIPLVYKFYCDRHFLECRYTFSLDRKMLGEMSNFAAWNFLGFFTGLSRDQGGNIIINMFCGTAVNAARSISMQVVGVVQGFVNNFMTALNPQITKQYAIGDYEYEKKLVCQGARLSFYILAILSIPIFINIDLLLHLWLGDVPEHTSLFIRLAIIFVMSESLSNPLATAVQASGRIKEYQMKIGLLQLTNLPLCYLLLRYGAFPEVVIVVSIITSQFCLLVRLWHLKQLIGLKIRIFIKKVYVNVIFVTLLSFIIPYVVFCLMDEGVLRLFISSLISIFASFLIILLLGANSIERNMIFGYVIRKLSKIKERN